jgi:hypothetical protein
MRSTSFRARRAGADPLGSLPPPIATALGSVGRGVLAVEGDDGSLAAIPVRWVVDGAGLYAAVGRSTLSLASAGRDARVALGMDRASWWRASRMTGAMVQGRAEEWVLSELGTGSASARRIVEAAGAASVQDAALVRIRPDRIVWWSGWSSGSVTLP